MNTNVRIRYTMKLASETIFGCGYSVPGEEDISVCQDGQGYPYLRGSTLKGLLRESFENLVCWGCGTQQDTEELFGVSGWSDTREDRRVLVTDLTLEDRPEDPEQCYTTRTSTSLENGVVKEGTLRTALCVRRGLTFAGTLTCGQGDAERLIQALQGIKWLGTLRNRGFGRVHMIVTGQEACAVTPSAVTGTCLAYRLWSELPVLITDLGRSHGNGYETRGYIPGAAVRGMVINTLASRNPEWFAQHSEEVLSSVRFLDAVPTCGTYAVLPSIKGFYETKEETELEHVIPTGEFQAGKKRARLGSFCGLDGDTIHYWSAETAGSMRMKRGRDGEDSMPFENRYLTAGQEFCGYVSSDSPELMAEISQVLSGEVWLGADRFAGFGKCRVTECKAVSRPEWQDVYGYRTQEDVGTVLYLLAVSPFTMYNKDGEPCGICQNSLAEQLGVSVLDMERCSTSVSEYGGYNRTWQCREGWMRMYDRGSLFRIVCDVPPTLEAIQTLEQKGLGIRTQSGFGQILFLHPQLLEGVTRKQAHTREENSGNPHTAQVRRARYDWIMKTAPDVQKNGLSNSQLGSIQALCEQAKGKGGDTADLDAFFKKNLEERGAKHARRFEEISKFVKDVLAKPVADTLGVSYCEDDRLGLLIQLFNYSRKGSKEVN